MRTRALVLAAFLVILAASASRAQTPTVADRMAVNLEALEIAAIQGDTGADGGGVIIAVVDTGVDPSHPALAFTPDGRPKLIDWVDFSGGGTFVDRAANLAGTRPAEGDVVLTPVAVDDPDLAEITGPAGRIHLGNLRSASGVYAVGVLDVTQFSDAAFAGGGAGDRSLRRRYSVVAIDSVEPGVYDTVIIDGDADGDLTDEPLLRPFRLDSTVGFLRAGDERDAARAAVVVTDLAPDGSLVNLGFDGSGHGTHVAGIAAGYQPGVYRGVAPGAQLMVLKALASSGQGTWSQIAAAVDYAVLRGVDIITISIDALTEPPAAGGLEANFLTRAARDCRCLIIVAAGNEGPGIGSGSTPGPADSVFAVGAYYTPAMIELDYGHRPAAPGVWSFSGMGPRADGSVLPNVVAPGRAPGPVPPWVTASGYRVYEGTSVAAPHAAGTAALLIDAAARRGLPVTIAQIRRALEQGARALPGYNLLEQGYGAVSAAGAWERLQRAGPVPALVAVPDLPSAGGPLGGPGGVHQRGSVPGNVRWALSSAAEAGDWQVERFASWLLPDRRRIRIAPGIPRHLHVDVAAMDRPGLYAGWVRLRRGDAAVDLLHSFVVPDPGLLRGEVLEPAGVVAPGTWRRHFIDVPPGAAALDVELEVEAAGASGTAARLLVYRPDGTRWWTGSLLGTHRAARGRTEAFNLPLPEPGVWELIVEAPFVEGGDLGPVSYRLKVAAPGVTWSDRDWWVSFAPGQVAAARSLEFHRLGHAGAVETVALGPAPIEPSILTVREQASVAQPAYHELRVPEDTALLEVTASVAGGSDVDLFLYRRRASGAPEEVGRGTDGRGGSEVVRIWFPQPGTYVIWGEVSSSTPVPVQLNIRILPTGTAGIRVSDGAAGPEMPAWTLRASIPRPDGDGRHHAVLAIEDTAAGYLLGVVPIRIDVGQPPVRLALQAVPVTGRGGLAWTALAVLDAATLRPVPAHVWIDGRLYAAPEGRLLLPQPLAIPAGGLGLRVLPAERGPREIRPGPEIVRPPFATDGAGGGSPSLQRRLAEIWRP